VGSSDDDKQVKKLRQERKGLRDSLLSCSRYAVDFSRISGLIGDKKRRNYNDNDNYNKSNGNDDNDEKRTTVAAVTQLLLIRSDCRSDANSGNDYNNRETTKPQQQQRRRRQQRLLYSKDVSTVAAALLSSLSGRNIMLVVRQVESSDVYRISALAPAAAAGRWVTALCSPCSTRQLAHVGCVRRCRNVDGRSPTEHQLPSWDCHPTRAHRTNCRPKVANGRHWQVTTAAAITS